MKQTDKATSATLFTSRLDLLHLFTSICCLLFVIYLIPSPDFKSLIGASQLRTSRPISSASKLSFSTPIPAPQLSKNGTLPNPKPKKNLIIDTDLFSDVDDAGALLLACTSLHANLLGVLVNKPSTYSVLCTSAIVSYYTSPPSQPAKKPIPIGVFRHRNLSDGSVLPLSPRTFLDVVYWRLSEFCSKIAFQYGSPSSPDCVHPSVPWDQPEKAWDSCQLYRKLLSEAADNSVTIVSIGFLDNLSLLLDSGPDTYSPLTGRELITRKVSELVIMGGRYPSGRSWNFFGSGPDLPHHNGGNGLGLGAKGTANVINMLPCLTQWKGRVVYIGEHVARNILTGAELVKKGPQKDPVGKAYRYYAYGEPIPSWDPVAVLYAIYGLGNGRGEEWFKWNERFEEGRNWVNERDATNKWVEDKDTKNQFVLALKPDKEETVAREVERLFLEGAWRTAKERTGLNEKGKGSKV